jgi:hypothetical protein
MAVMMFCDRLVPSMTGMPACTGGDRQRLKGNDEGEFSG